jgi:hypothetical protein
VLPTNTTVSLSTQPQKACRLDTLITHFNRITRYLLPSDQLLLTLINSYIAHIFNKSNKTPIKLDKRITNAVYELASSTAVLNRKHKKNKYDLVAQMCRSSAVELNGLYKHKVIHSFCSLFSELHSVESLEKIYILTQLSNKHMKRTR